VHLITADPTRIAQTLPSGLNITSMERTHVLAGYINGFRVLFIVNTSLAALAAVVAYFMIHHKELTREDDEKRKADGRYGVEEAEMTKIDGTGTLDDNGLVKRTMPERVENT